MTKIWLLTLTGLCILMISPISAIPGGAYQGEAESPMIWTQHAWRRIDMDELPDEQAGSHAVIKLARNESEPFQLIVRAADNEPLENVEVSLILPEGISSQVYLEGYVEVTKASGYYEEDYPPIVNYNPVDNTPEAIAQKTGFYADPLIPLVRSFDVPAGQNQPLWIELFTTADTAPGQFPGSLQVMADGTVIGTVNLDITVWDFALPDEPLFRLRFWGVDALIYSEESEIDEEGAFYINRLKEMYYWMAAHHLDILDFYPQPAFFITDSGHLDMDFTQSDVMLDILLNVLHQQYLLLPVPDDLNYLMAFAEYEESYDSDTIDEQRALLQAYFDIAIPHYRQRGQLDKLTFFIVDEPGSQAAYEEILYWIDWLQEQYPDVRTLVTDQPIPDNPDWPVLDVDSWSMPMTAYDGMDFDPDLLRTMIDELRASGDFISWYGALMIPPQPSLNLDQMLMGARVIPWMSYFYDMDSFDYWSPSYWIVNPWEDTLSWNDPYGFGDYLNGEGVLTYPGWQVEQYSGQPNPGVAISSIRLALLRQGQEDFAYLKLLEESDGDPAPYVNALMTSLVRFEPDPTRWIATREQIAREILKSPESNAFMAIPPPSQAYLDMPASSVELCQLQYLIDPDCEGEDEQAWCQVYYQLYCETGEEPSDEEVDTLLYGD